MMKQTDLRTKLSLVCLAPLLITFIVCETFIKWATTKKVEK